MMFNMTCEASEEKQEYVKNIPIEMVVAPSSEKPMIVEKEAKQPLCREVKIEKHNGIKTWMPYNLFGKKTLQYELQQYAGTDSLGFRYINGRYLCAIGTGADVEIGQYFDLVLENEEIIPCIVGDIKAPNDTNNDNLTTSYSGCVCEFIVDDDVLIKSVKRSGDVSKMDESYDSPVVEIRVYEQINFFGGEDDNL